MDVFLCPTFIVIYVTMFTVKYFIRLTQKYIMLL